MKISLGCMKLPFEGDLNMGIVATGILFGLGVVTLVFNLVSESGPAMLAQTGGAVTMQAVLDACSSSVVVTVAWCIMYYNYIGTAVLGTFGNSMFEMFTDEDVTDKYGPIASRFSGNMMEQSLPFLLGLWMYTLFVDYNQAKWLGITYLVARGLYPLMYIVNGKFTHWFEFLTQPGYGVVGVLLLGSFIQAVGGNWKDWGSFGAPICGFLFGSLAIFPALPLGLPYAVLHYMVDSNRREEQDIEKYGYQE